MACSYEILLQPPEVACRTRIWHPNITENGEVCLSVLRETSIDGTGWSPARSLKVIMQHSKFCNLHTIFSHQDVVWGLDSLFTVS